MSEHINKDAFAADLMQVLRLSIASDYCYELIQNEEFFDLVISDVEETSAWSEDMTYNEDDIRLAIGRALLYKFGIEY
jgi:hypothetical protein